MTTGPQIQTNQTDNDSHLRPNNSNVPIVNSMAIDGPDCKVKHDRARIDANLEIGRAQQRARFQDRSKVLNISADFESDLKLEEDDDNESVNEDTSDDEYKVLIEENNDQSIQTEVKTMSPTSMKGLRIQSTTIEETVSPEDKKFIAELEANTSPRLKISIAGVFRKANSGHWKLHKCRRLVICSQTKVEALKMADKKVVRNQRNGRHSQICRQSSGALIS